MRKVIVKGRELRDVDVDFISSVGRPASRVPISIMKSEDQHQGATSMFDVLFKKSDAPAPAAAIVSVILKSEPTEAVTKALGDLGIKIDEKQEVDGVVLLVQDTVVAKEDTAIVKINEDLAVAVPVLKMDGDFAAHCAQRGFYPTISIATDLLQEELYKSVSKAKDGSDAAEMIAKATSDFGSYMAQLARQLPSTIFKMEESAELIAAFVAKTDKVAVIETPAAEPVAEVVADVEKGEDELTADEIVDIEKGAGKTWAEMTPEEQAAEKAKKKGKTDKVAKADETPAFDMAAMIEMISKSVSDQVTPALQAVGDKVDALGARVDAVETVSKSAADTVSRSVLGTVFEDKQPQVVEKAEKPLPLLDTGFRV